MTGSRDLYVSSPHLAPPLLLTFGEGRAERGGEAEEGPAAAPCTAGSEGEEGASPDLRDRREGMVAAWAVERGGCAVGEGAP
jgi:hypothetical protein